MEIEAAAIGLDADVVDGDADGDVSPPEPGSEPE
jgi:hypothetical protein